MPTVHLLHGLPGTGKTTFAHKLAAELNAVRLTHDEWMTILYGTNPPAEHFADYHDRVLSLIWKMAAEFISHDIDVILDHGFWTRKSRDAARAQTQAIGATPKFYRLVCPDPVADARVLERSKNPRPGVLLIDAAALELFRSRYEPLGEDELHIIVNTHE
ncbi:MAG: ATP-binding protein [Opitutaceae bacterium]|nr:ATP-binding protein [Opitutaceae bacterium]MBP9913358.1 ATP-binding protein [Opitutaceae bacterium]